MKRSLSPTAILPLIYSEPVPISSPGEMAPANRVRAHRRTGRTKLSLVLFAISVVVVAALAWPARAATVQVRTEIQFWHAMEGHLGEAVSELVKQFNLSQGEFEVKAVYKGTYLEVQAAAMAAYRQKNQPHIVQIFEVGSQSMVLSETIIPVYRLMKQQQVEIDWADFIETVTGYYSKDNRLSSLPFNVSAPIVYYNKEIFRKAGLGDTPPATWQEVETTSRKILNSGAATCGFTAAWPSWTMLENMFTWHDQPFATNQNGYTGLDTRLLINSNFGLMQIGALAQWQKENIFSYGGRLREADPKFINGECAMLVDTSAFIGLHGSSLTFEWGTGQIPRWGPPYPKASSLLGGASLWVMRGLPPADYKGVAQFLKFLTGPRQQMWWAATTGFVPITRTAVKGLEDSGFYQRNPDQWTAMSQFLNAPPTPNSRGIRLGNYAQLRDVFEGEMEDIFTGKKTVKEGLDAAVLRGNAILREFSVIHGAAPQGEI
jgi:sn-glycerol 3-phosphate transport system substrate-binding protein